MPQFKTIVNTGAEVGYVSIRNDSGSALSAGQVVVWDMAGTEDGLRVIDPSGTTAALVVGLAVSATANGDKGLAQVYGLVTNAIVARVGSASNDSVAVGDIYDIYSASSCLSYIKAGGAVLGNTFAATNNAAATAIPPMFVAAASVASGGASSLSTTTAKVFVRCL